MVATKKLPTLLVDVRVARVLTLQKVFCISFEGGQCMFFSSATDCTSTDDIAGKAVSCRASYVS